MGPSLMTTISPDRAKDWVAVAREGNAQHELDAAMQDGVSKVFAHIAFIGSL